MPLDRKHAANCRWGTPTLFLSGPLWLEAWDAPWTCVRDVTPCLIDTTEACATCARWEPRHMTSDPVLIVVRSAPYRNRRTRVPDTRVRREPAAWSGHHVSRADAAGGGILNREGRNNEISDETGESARPSTPRVCPRGRQVEDR
jgi:hypothetical protein